MNLLLTVDTTTRSMTHAQPDAVYDNPDLVRVVAELTRALTWGYIALGVALIVSLGLLPLWFGKGIKNSRPIGRHCCEGYYGMRKMQARD